MVYYHISNVVAPPAFIYVGKDKVESTWSSKMPVKLRLKHEKMRI